MSSSGAGFRFRPDQILLDVGMPNFQQHRRSVFLGDKDQRQRRDGQARHQGEKETGALAVKHIPVWSNVNESLIPHHQPQRNASAEIDKPTMK